ncbi:MULTISPECIES: hypothetical protein [unclassified Achromobacter]|uniref:hypothetical protein n=1 Tax=unclassified Achromobacter TaxID=2626865 RepID=UPI000B51CFAE|nr:MULTISPECIES: hypothetical protein [unclassified Achromobacter]OWT72922.1 hypothetical protein CEY05_23860 [Achromobacter sp. HZ34]OWT74140.1 hypothetical protein CEY04_22695 [Achromobacter sp. HZ28]
MAVADGYRLALDVERAENGEYVWLIYIAMSRETGKGTLVDRGTHYMAASAAAAAGMRALERYTDEQRITVMRPTPSVSATVRLESA